MGYFFLAVAVFCNAIANVFLKLAAEKPLSFSFSGGISKAVSDNGYLLLGLSLFVVNVLFYVAALRALPLSVAYPLMMGLTFLIVSSAAVFFLGESFTLWHLAGYVLILAGIVAVSAFGAA
ncbi:hypothetical protein HY091_00280 [Candidatus Kaiserbacteria bacterium]|nr:hypothetical protein [Candidatus Kaiserbacteria bacterium]